MPTSPVDGPFPSARGNLSRERVLTAAVRFVDEQGLRALTMRGLAAELGVEAMALYRYVPSREKLLDGVVETVVDELYSDPDVQLRPDGDWQDYLRHLARGVRRLAIAHPEVFPIVATRPPAAPWIRPPLRSLRWVEAFLDALLSRGFPDAGAVAAYRAFSSFLLGHLLLEVSAKGVDTGPMDEPDPPKDATAAARKATSVPGLESYPQLLRLAPELAQDHAEAEFESSLDNLLERIAELSSAGTDGRPPHRIP
jgi:AcrR family transcriptional regulator